jgi:hypothetical protein
VGTLPALVGFKVPDFNLGDTFTQMARLSAYEQSRRTSELEQEEKRGKLDRDRLWRSTIAGAFPTADPRAPAGLNAMPPQAQAQPQTQAPPVTGGLAGPQPISQGPSMAGPQGMASQVPTNQWMDINPQTGEWSTPGGMSAPPTSPMAPGGLTRPQSGMPSAITAMAQPEAPGQPSLQGGGLTLAQPQSAATGQAGASTGTLGSPQPSRPLEAMVPGLMPMPDMRAVQAAFAIDPEKTSTWYSSYLTQRGKQLEEVKHNNELVHQVTGAMLDNPGYYKEGLAYLREQGVPVPKNMPQEYNPALVKFHYDTSGKRLDPLQDAQRQTYLAEAALKRDKLQTEELTRQGIRGFLAGEGGQAGTGTTGGGVEPSGTAGNLGQRHNNPYNVKRGAATEHWIEQGLAEPGDKATDGGQFLRFKDPKIGAQAGRELLLGAGYRDLTVEDAMRKWSGKGYGADVAKDIPGDTKIRDLTPAQRETLMAGMREREGWNAGRQEGTATSGRVADLRQQIAAKQQRARQASVTPGLENAATQLRSEITDLQQELARLEEPGRELAKQTALQPGELAKQRAGAEVTLEAKMNEPIGAENAIKMNLPPQTKWKDVPKDVKVLDRPGEGVAKELGTFKASHEGITRVIGMLDQPGAKSIIGTLLSSEDNAAFRRAAGEWISSVTPAERKFAAALVAEIAGIRNTISGQAVSKDEAEFLKPMLPSVADPDIATVRAKLEVLQEWIARKHEGARGQLEEMGFRTPKALVTGSASAAAPPTSNVDKFRAIRPQ